MAFPPPPVTDDLRALLWPLDPRAFFARSYARRAHYAPPASARGFIVGRVYGQPGSEDALDALLRAVHALYAYQSARVEGRRYGADVRVPSTYSALRAELLAGRSFVAHVPSIRELRAATATGRRLALRTLEQLARLRHRLESALRMPMTANLYISGRSSVALAPHTDTTDTVVLQLEGRKRWRVCVPVLTAELEGTLRAGLGGEPGALSDADMSELLEAHLASEPGCTAHTEASLRDSRRFACAAHEMRPASLLWLPKGLVHAAQESGESAQNMSVHLTLGLRRGGLRFVDLLARAAEAPGVREAAAAAVRAAAAARGAAEQAAEAGVCAAAAAVGSDGGRNCSAAERAQVRGEGGDGAAAAGAQDVGDGGSALLAAALDELSSGARGIAWRRPLPTWLFGSCAPAGAEGSTSLAQGGDSARGGKHGGAVGGAEAERALHGGLAAGERRMTALDATAHNASAWTSCAPLAGSAARAALAAAYGWYAQHLARVASDRLLPVGRGAEEGAAAGASQGPAVHVAAQALAEALLSDAAFERALEATALAAGALLEAGQGTSQQPEAGDGIRGTLSIHDGLPGGTLGMALVGVLGGAVLAIGVMLLLEALASAVYRCARREALHLRAIAG